MGPDAVLRLHARLAASRADGPGRRAVVWLQGCTLACRGCFNPATHAAGGEPVAVDDLARWLAALDGIDGVTVSGGEPFQQAPALARLLARLRRASDLSLIAFSGYRLAEIARLDGGTRALANLDALIAGRYVPARHHGRALLGSANQTLHLLSHRHCAAEFAAVPEAELQIAADGTVAVSGVAPPALQL